MEAVADLLIAVADLVEAEGQALRRGFLRLLIGCLLLATSGVFTVGGFALLLWGVYYLLARSIGPAPGALVSGAIALLLALLLFLSARLVAR